MYFRHILNELANWKESSNRKPLILRGARQVGKTTAVTLHAQSYPQFIHLNLEKADDARLFRQHNNVKSLTEAICFNHGKDFLRLSDTLLFIDEIQQVPEAIAMLRYFFEELPQLHVIAAGSLFETVLNEEISIPVGRVEYRVMRPVSFHEFLMAIGEKASAKALTEIPLKNFAHEKLLSLFHTYSLLGGMPEVIRQYADNRNLTSLASVYESILVSYMDDVEKYARNSNMVQIIRHVIQSAYREAGNRIAFQGFGQSNYKSREVGEALRVLQKTLLLELVYPVTQTKLPLLPDFKKKPKLFILDTGLVNHFAGLQKSLLGQQSLFNLYEGRIAEQVVAQELLTNSFSALHHLNFWVREKKDASAEVDFVVPYGDRLVSVEVKSGHAGKLRSLQQFMELSDVGLAIRLYQGNIDVHTATTPSGKKFKLLNLPYYLASQLNKYLVWASQS